MPTISCGGPIVPVCLPRTRPTGKALIAAAIAQFRNQHVDVEPHRIPSGFRIGRNDIDPTGSQGGGACQQTWANAGFSYTTWLAHVQSDRQLRRRTQSPDKQIIVSLAGNASPASDLEVFPNPAPLLYYVSPRRKIKPQASRVPLHFSASHSRASARRACRRPARCRRRATFRSRSPTCIFAKRSRNMRGSCRSRHSRSQAV